MIRIIQVSPSSFSITWDRLVKGFKKFIKLLINSLSRMHPQQRKEDITQLLDFNV